MLFSLRECLDDIEQAINVVGFYIDYFSAIRAELINLSGRSSARGIPRGCHKTGFFEALEQGVDCPALEIANLSRTEAVSNLVSMRW
ncbi:MAG: hypothetical protein Q4F64_06890 [Corynebacterium casei]|nr:hypothetical protein [Corynebacterium casei]